MNENYKKLIEENIEVVKFSVNSLINKGYIPKSEYEDYYQMGCLELCKKVHLYNGQTKFKTFAHKVLHNFYIDVYRKSKVNDLSTISYEEIIREDDNGELVELERFLSSKSNVENEVLYLVTREMIKKHISDAKSKAKAVTTIHAFEALELKMDGYSGKEIAKMYGVQDNLVRSWISRAKKLLLRNNSFRAVIADL